MPLNYVTLTGTIPGGTPAGMVAFTPSNWLIDTIDKLLIPPMPVPMFLSASGEFSVPLLATDNAAASPAGWFWTVTISGIPGVAYESWSFFLPYANGATQDISTLAPIFPVAVMSGGQFQGAVAPAESPLASGAVIPVNATAGNLFRVTLTQNAQLQNPTGGFDGQLIRVEVTQGTGGPYTLSYGTAYDFGAAGPPSLSTQAGKRDVLGLSKNTPAGTWDVLAFEPGY